MTTRISVKPRMLRWCMARAGVDVETLSKGSPHLPKWLDEKERPTLKQLERFAKATHTPVGYLFLPEPPEEKVPISDFRTLPKSSGRSTISGEPRPSPNLLDTIYTMQDRQRFLRDVLLEEEAEPLSFVGSAHLSDDPIGVGMEMRRIVGIDEEVTNGARNWQEAVSNLRRSIEDLGIIAVVNGVVGNNTRRRLSVEEFRGFAISDRYAPLIFVNGADAKSAQMFTLAHELAHIWLGEGGVSGEVLFPTNSKVETWCNRAAAECLVPGKRLKDLWNDYRRDEKPFEKLAKKFKVSPIVIARRALDLRLTSREEFFAFYQDYTSRERTLKSRDGGGDFYRTQNTRVGALLAERVMRAALEGRIGFKEAYDLTGLRGGTFQEYALRLGVSI